MHLRLKSKRKESKEKPMSKTGDDPLQQLASKVRGEKQGRLAGNSGSRFHPKLAKLVTIDKTPLLKVMEMTAPTKSRKRQASLSQLEEFLLKNGMEDYAKLLEESGIDSYQALTRLREQDVDKLALPPGFKLKLKRQIGKAFVLTPPPFSFDVSRPFSNQEQSIEEIVSKRRTKTAIAQQDQIMHQAGLARFDPQDNANLQAMFGQQIIQFERVRNSSYQKQNIRIGGKEMAKEEACHKKMLNRDVDFSLHTDNEVIKLTVDSSSGSNSGYGNGKGLTNARTDSVVQVYQPQIQKVETQATKVPAGVSPYCYTCLKLVFAAVCFNGKQFCSQICLATYRADNFSLCSKCKAEFHLSELRSGRFGWVCEDDLLQQQQRPPAQLWQEQLLQQPDLQF